MCLGRLGLVFEFLTQPSNVDVHGSRRDEGLFSPDLLEDLFPRQHLTSMIDQQAE